MDFYTTLEIPLLACLIFFLKQTLAWSHILLHFLTYFFEL